MNQLFLACSVVPLPRNGADRIDVESDFEADSVRYPDRIEEVLEFPADPVRYTDRIEEELKFPADSVRRPS